MKLDNAFQAGLLLGLLVNQSKMQQQMIENQQTVIQLQQQVIGLQKRVDEMTPKTPGDDVRWHIFSGLDDEDVVASDDLKALKALYKWVSEFGRKYVKGYVHPTVYSEIMNHMGRGLSRRIAEIETLAKFSTPSSSPKKPKIKSTKSAQATPETNGTSNSTENPVDDKPPQQLALIQ